MTRLVEDRPRVFFHPPTVLFTGIFAGYVMRIFMGGFLPIPRLVGEGLGIALTLAGVSIFITAISIFAEADETLKPDTPTHQLLKSGPFTRSRNPIYLGMMLFGLGLGLATLNSWIILTTFLTGLILHFLVILPEERYLSEQFGAEFNDYKKEVRRWI